MIRTLINLLGSFYENNDFSKAEAVANTIHTAIPDDQVSLKFLGLVYFRTGRIKDVIRLFDLVQFRQKPALEVSAAKTSSRQLPVVPAAAVLTEEAKRRVPYLAQAWADLGKALMTFRQFELVPAASQNAVFA